MYIMELSKLLLAVTVLACLLCPLAGCSNAPTEQTTAPTATAPTQATTVPVPTLSPADRYNIARQEISAANNLAISYTYNQSRSVAGETFTESRLGTASYSARNSAGMEALISEDLTFGSYNTRYYQSYIGGSAYCRVNNCSFRCDMTGDAFYALQIPAVLMDETLYGSVVCEDIDAATRITFENPDYLEWWVTDNEYAELVTAYGSATLDAGGNLVSASYHAEYTISAAAYVLDVSVQIETPDTLDFSAQQPVYSENCTVISDLQIPEYLLQVVGDVYTAQAMTASYTDTVYSQAFSMIRTQCSDFNIFGAGSDLMASTVSQVTVRDYTGVSTANSQTISYRNGVYSYSINNGETVTDDTVSAADVRASGEDSILNALFMLDAIAGAELTDTGDFLYISFTGTDDYVNTICSNIYTLFGMNLDTFAQSYSTDSAGGYLTLNKHTGLPTAMGMYVSRTHIIDGVDYVLTYQLDQSVALPSVDAYENITGNLPAETLSDDAATPLFYKVTGENGAQMWLLGTIQVGDSRTASLPRQVMSAFYSADALAVPYDLAAFEAALTSDVTVQAQLTDAYYYSNGSTTGSHLSLELYNEAYPLLLATGYNSINSPYMKVVIWESLIEELYLRQSYALSIRLNVDHRLQELAIAQAKPIYEMETGLAHLQLVSSFSDDLQAAMLEDLLTTGLIGYVQEAQQLYTLWCEGDEEALTAALLRDTSNVTEEQLKLYNEYTKALYTNHDKTLLSAAEGYLSSGETVFFTAELSHLLGDNGLIAALREAGYTVELVSYE